MKDIRIDNPNSVETTFCVPFGKMKQHSMDKETSDLFLKLCIASNEMKKMDIPDSEKPFSYKVLESSLKHRFTFTIEDETLMLFIAFHVQSPGTIIMYLTYLQYSCKQKGVRNLDWTMFSELFAMGFPCEKDLQEIWNSQKVKRENMSDNDNLLDYQSAMKSIQFEN